MARFQQPTVLLVEDTAPVAMIYKEYLQNEHYSVLLAENGAKAMQQLDKTMPDAMVLDLLLPDADGLEILSHAHSLYPQLPIIVVTINNSLDVAVDAMRRGACDFLVKPFPNARLATTLQNALAHNAAISELREWRQIVGQNRFHGFVGQSAAMQAVYRIIDTVAASRTSIFIKGERGTGKSMAAKAIHMASPRRNKPFITVDCAAIAPAALEQEIFGYAGQNKPGLAREADGGTLFLNKVCAMPPDVQGQFLRLVQSGEVIAAGSHRADKVDVRLICSTSRDIHEEVREHRFREDLYYRLHVIPLDMPPLHEREDDILLLANHFLSIFCAEEGRDFTGFTQEVIQMFRRYEWPGNVRQLENVVHNVTALHNGQLVTEAMLPADLNDFTGSRVTPPANQNQPDLVLARTEADAISKPLWLVEKEAIMNAIEFSGHDITQAAELLEISPATLYRKLQLWRYPRMNELRSGGAA